MDYKTLRAHGFTNKQIDDLMFNYTTAVENEIPYPMYYAIIKLFHWQVKIKILFCLLGA